MDYFIWDKKSNLLGLTADTLFSSRPDLRYDDVIVIHKKGEPENVVMVETKNELRITYDIDSTSADVVGFITAIILAGDNPQTIQEKLDNIDNKKEEEKENVPDELSKEDEDVLFEYAKMLEDLMKQELGLDIENYDFEYQDDEPFNLPIPLSGQYEDPQCKIIDLSDVGEDVVEKKLNIVLKHAFISETTDVSELKFMESFNNELKELEDQREKYANESDFEMVEITTQKIDNMRDEIMDSCDATLSIDVNAVYKYEEHIMVDCVNGQTIIMDRSVVDSMRTTAYTYDKTKENSNEKYKVYYKTVNVSLNECYNEVVERNNTVFVIKI